jgi:hypothetical protein
MSNSAFVLMVRAQELSIRQNREAGRAVSKGVLGAFALLLHAFVGRSGLVTAKSKTAKCSAPDFVTRKQPMLNVIRTVSLVAALLVATVSFSQAPAGAPAGSTGLCKDGSYWTGPTKKGACRGHKGVQQWFAATGTGAAAAGAPAPNATTAAPAPAPSTPATQPPASAARGTAAPARPTSTPPATAAPGGGPGLVWVNKSSKVYHCPSDRWYGKTKQGAYLTEADATAQGYRPDHGKACH